MTTIILFDCSCMTFLFMLLWPYFYVYAFEEETLREEVFFHLFIKVIVCEKNILKHKLNDVIQFINTVCGLGVIVNSDLPSPPHLYISLVFWFCFHSSPTFSKRVVFSHIPALFFLITFKFSY